MNQLYTFDLTKVAQSNPDNVTISNENPFQENALLFKPDVEHNFLTLPVDNTVPWDQANYLIADVYHDNQHSDMILFEFYSKDTPDKVRITSKMGILPELKTRLVLPLEYLDGQTFFMERQERRLKGVMPGNRLPKEKIGAVKITLEPMTETYAARMWITNIRLTNDKPAPLPDEKPIVDELGQWMKREWLGKIKDETQLKTALNDFYIHMQEASFPENWSKYGGWNEKVFEATGFFRVQKDGERWWLADPEGYAFFSVGVDVMNPSSFGPVTGMKDLHQWLPSEDSEFSDALQSRRGREAVSFLTSNLIRVFGDDYIKKWQQLSKGLLIENRFNTIGNWSDLDFIKSAKMPYVLPLRNFPTTELQLYRDFPDVFSEEYRTASIAFAKQMEQFKDDAYMIGYFLRNEPLWAFGENNIASEMLATEQSSATRKQLVDWLKNKYQNNISELSKAWNSEFESFQQIETKAIYSAASLSATASNDLYEFSKLMVDEYISQPSIAIKKIDPNHMNLGIRYGWISSELCYRGAEHFEVFSINSYSDKPDEKVISEITERSGKPVMIGEFHHGAVDRGLPSTGLRGVTSQQERGVAYRYYVEQGATMPGLVGMHYFQLNDQPVLGRFDGENYNIGIVDIYNLPHKELAEAMKKTNSAIYEVASGKQKAFDKMPQLMPPIFF